MRSPFFSERDDDGSVLEFEDMGVPDEVLVSIRNKCGGTDGQMDLSERSVMILIRELTKWVDRPRAKSKMDARTALQLWSFVSVKGAGELADDTLTDLYLWHIDNNIDHAQRVPSMVSAEIRRRKL